MATPDPEKQAELLIRIDDLQKKIQGFLGSQVFDYIFLFSNREPPQITIDSLSPQTEELIESFNKLAEEFLVKLGVNLQLNEPDTGKKFLQLSRELYMARYIAARQEYAEYQLVRVSTPIERKLLQIVPDVEGFQQLPGAVTMAFPNAFEIDDLGRVDIKATEAKERQDHLISSYLSTVAEIGGLSRLLVKAYEEITIFGFVPVFYKDQLLQICDRVAQTLEVHFAQQVYAYLSRGLSPSQAKLNVQSYYTQLTAHNQTEFHPSMSEIGNEVHSILDEELPQLKQLYPPTRAAVKAELIEVIVFMINEGDFIPAGYYELRFRSNANFDTYEQRFNALIDLYIILDDGTQIPSPMETYNIEYTQESKAEIFDAVTAGIENPRFTLADYLSEET
jgi:hypothetical protein